MKKSLKLQLIAVAALIALVSCGDIFNSNVVVGEGEPITETQNFSNFYKIKSEIGADINIVESDESKIVVTIQENLLSYLSTDVSDGLLTISFNNNIVRTDKGIVVDIYTASVEKFTLTGAGDVDSALPIPEIILTGAGNIKCVGELEDLYATITGAGNFNFYDMPTRNANIRITGTGDVKVMATHALDVTISGVGTVYYKGTPTVTTTITGVGNVENCN
jgi:hypothetical protein